jgi:hypothetical protein
MDERLAALDVAEAFDPAIVIAGHATRRYLTDARRLLESSNGPTSSTKACWPCTATG